MTLTPAAAAISPPREAWQHRLHRVLAGTGVRAGRGVHANLSAPALVAAALRREERIGDDAFHRLEEELDWAEAELDGSRH